MPAFLASVTLARAGAPFLTTIMSPTFKSSASVIFTVSSSTAVFELRSVAKTSGTSVPSFNTTGSLEAAAGGGDAGGLAAVVAGGMAEGAGSWAFAESCSTRTEVVRQKVARTDRSKIFMLFPPLDALLVQLSGLISRWDSRLERTAEVKGASERWHKHSCWLACARQSPFLDAFRIMQCNRAKTRSPSSISDAITKTKASSTDWVCAHWLLFAMGRMRIMLYYTGASAARGLRILSRARGHHERTNQGRIARAHCGTGEAGRRIETQRVAGISRRRKRRRQRLWPRPLPRHTLLRAMDTPAGYIGKSAHIPGRKQTQVEAQDQGITSLPSTPEDLSQPAQSSERRGRKERRHKGFVGAVFRPPSVFATLEMAH